jgi:hypothetical protein
MQRLIMVHNAQNKRGKKSFNAGWQEMFRTIGTIGLITYAKA